MRIQTTKVYEILESQKEKRISVLQGGARAGKTYNILIWLILTIGKLTEPKVITICRKTLPALKKSVLRDFISILEIMGIYDHNNMNKSELVYTLNDIHKFEFISVDEAAKVRGYKRDYLFINEANELDYEDFNQLIMRTVDKAILDYNPSDMYSWIYEQVIPRSDTAFSITTYLDNKFLEKSVIHEIEQLKSDPYYWAVYGEGRIGITKAQVYTNWEIVDSLPQDLFNYQHIYGLDFGFSHPTALIELYINDDQKEVYINELIYESSLTIPQLIERMKELNINRNTEIIADNARPEAIEDIYQQGFNCMPCNKGKNSVQEGIDYVRRFKQKITKWSVNVKKEITTYKKKEDKNGNALEDIVKINDHSMDAVRYGLTFAKQSEYHIIQL